MTSDGFAVYVGDIIQRMDPGFAKGALLVQERLHQAKYPLVSLGELAQDIQYGTSQRADVTPIGTPILRMSNLQDDGIDLSDLKYVTLAKKEIDRYRLEPGDLLFNRTNSKELVGKCAVFNAPNEYVFASYLLRVRIDPSVADPWFIATFINSPTGRLQIDTVSRQIIGMANVNTGELKRLRIPLPPLPVQRELASDAAGTWHSSVRFITEADSLETSVGTMIDGAAGMSKVPIDPPRTYAISLAAIQGRRLDALSYRRPAQLDSDITFAPLGTLATLGGAKPQIMPDETGTVPYVGLPECDQTRVVNVLRRPLNSITGRRVARPGDILFARIEPSIFNKKYIWLGDIGEPEIYTSGEFHILTPKVDLVSNSYLYACLFSATVFSQVQGKTTGSSGRRRLHSSLLETVQVPLPARTTQEELGRNVLLAQQRARDLRERARIEWDAAKLDMELQLFEEKL